MKKTELVVTRNTENGGDAFWRKVDSCRASVEGMSPWKRNCPVISTAARVGMHKVKEST